jgi:hypothetical protein
MVPSPLLSAPDTMWMFLPDISERRCGTMKKWYVLASPTMVTAVGAALLAGCVTLLAGKDDIRRFWQIHNM